MAVSVQIDEVFLAKALGDEFEILEFHATPGSKPGDNYLSLIYTVDVTMRSKITEQTSTRHLLVKCYPAHPGRQEFNNQTNIFYKELELYRVWLPELVRFQEEVVGMIKPYKIPYPPYVYGKATDFTKVDRKNEYLH
jgi:hypothetical protein